MIHGSALLPSPFHEPPGIIPRIATPFLCSDPMARDCTCVMALPKGRVSETKPIVATDPILIHVGHKFRPTESLTRASWAPRNSLPRAQNLLSIRTYPHPCSCLATGGLRWSMPP